MMVRLGYPPYLPLITGVWKLPCAMALVSPRFQRVKEWAYAGAFFSALTPRSAMSSTTPSAPAGFGLLLLGASDHGAASRRPDQALPGTQRHRGANHGRRAQGRWLLLEAGAYRSYAIRIA